MSAGSGRARLALGSGWIRGIALGASVLLLAGALGCAGTLSPQARAGRAAYLEAVAVLGGDRAAGISALEAFLAAHPQSLYADDAALRLAELALEDGRSGEAVRRLEWALDHHPRGDKSHAIRLELGARQLEDGDAQAAAETLQPMRESLLDVERRRAAHRLRGRVARALGDEIQELRWLGRVRADQEDPESAAEVEARIDEILGEQDESELEAAARRLGRRMPAGRLWLHRAERFLRAGRAQDASLALDRASGLPLTVAEASRLAHLKQRLSGTAPGMSDLPEPAEGAGSSSLEVPGVEATLGAVLPLSGPFAEFGQETLQGILLAAGLFDVGRSAASGVRVVVRDSGGDPARAAAAVAELADDPSVLAVLGPLTGLAAEAAAPVAEDRQLPLVTLTRRESVPALGRYVLRVGATPRYEVELLADYAVRELALRRFAILYPDDAYGQEMRGAFWDAVESRGGQVVGVARYAADAKDFAAPIRRLIGFEFLSGAQEAALAEQRRLRKRAKRLPAEEAAELRKRADELRGSDGSPLPPFVDFEALFIPDAYANVGLIAPHLAFHDVRGVRLLGTGGWSHPDLVELGGNHVDGAVFAAPFFAGSEVPFVAEFVRRYRDTFEADPSDLAARSFDATHLVLLQVARGAGAREAVLTGLLGARNVIGASGVLSIGADGSAQNRPKLLGVDRGRIVSVDETGTAPYLRIPEPVGPADDGI